MAFFAKFVVLILLLNIAVSLSQKYQDVCKMKKDTGLCRAAFRRYFYNSRSGRCEAFIYGGCGGNDNNFKTLLECRKVCGCRAPAKTGRCRARFPRYYYNHKRGRCLKFIYGGCGANENNFTTKSICMKTCA